MNLSARLPTPDAKYGVLCISLSIIFFRTLDHLFKWLTPPESVSSKGPEYIWKWRNMLVSWIHALLIGTWDMLCFYYYPQLMKDPVNHITPFTYYMVAVSTGYFLFDFWEMYKKNLVFKLWELTLHHFAVLSAFIYNVLTVRYIAYTVIALLAEINSIFLHTRKLLQMHHLPITNPLCRINSILNLFTFAFCRGFALFRITYGMYTEPEKMSTFYLILLIISMFIMNMLNPVLFYILLRNDFLKSPKKYDKISTVINSNDQYNNEKQLNNQINSAKKSIHLNGYNLKNLDLNSLTHRFNTNNGNGTIPDCTDFILNS